VLLRRLMVMPRGCGPGADAPGPRPPGL